MNKISDTKKKIAECAGLWLAEGSTRSKSEITFTNSCLDLVDLFYKTINQLFENCNYNQRIYVYTRNGKKITLPYNDCVIKYYIHKRATKPFLIFRIASVKLVKEWNKVVNEVLSARKLSPYIIRGFFAGEGNIKEASHNSRVLRVSQKEQKEFIDNMLKNLNIKYKYSLKERSYNISGKKNWDIFAKLRLADLHPDKKEKFWKVYQNFKEEHYDKNFIINNILPILNEPKTTRQLSQIFNRTPARIQDVLISLKKQKRIRNFRVKSVDYWTNNLDLVIISKIKKDYLLLLNEPKQTSEFAKHFKVDWKSSFKRLKELERLNLTRRQENGRWIKLQTSKTVLAI